METKRNPQYLVALGALLCSAVVLHACGTAVEDLYEPLTIRLDGGPPLDCKGDPTKDATIVRDGCGVFVSASAPAGGDGKKATPFQSFAEAAHAGAKRVFVCAGGYTEAKQVVFSGGVEVYGGFTNCTTSWTWSASAHAEVATIADVPGIVLDGGANHIENMSVTAPGSMTVGGSSIAVLVNGGSLDMANGVLTAGDAKDGDTGATTSDDTTLDGDPGDPGSGVCSGGASNPGAKGKTKSCITGGSSTGGDGGDGGDPGGDPAGNGTDGVASPSVGQAPDGVHGSGEGQGAPGASCSDGTKGANGSVGNSGDGASGIGALSKDGYAGGAGKDGASGTPGQGGGGGGGAKGAKAVTCNSVTVDRFGASGGAGGAGGCGGALGGGGQPGGSSIALLVLDAKVALAGVTLAAGQAGNGGGGGSGQSGGKKGTGGDPGAGGSANDSCRGGDGGKGGNGGPGGGGQGGHSLGIAFKGTKAPTGGTFQIDTTKNGKGGAPGANSSAAKGGGADGQAVNCLDFTTGKACGT